MMNSKLSLLIFFLLVQQVVFAQRGSGDSLKSGDVFIIKEFEPRISDAFKLSDNPKVEDTVVQVDQNVPYKVRAKRLETSFEPKPIKPAKMKGEPLRKLYKGYGLLGLGNNLTTRAELVLTSARSRKWDYGFEGWHHGSNGNVKDRGYSGFSDNHFNLYGKKFLYNKIVSANLNYDINALHKYGFNPNSINSTVVLEDSLGRDATAQNFQNLEPTLTFKTYYKDSSQYNLDFKLKYYRYWDKQKSTENNVYFKGAIDRYFGQEFAQLEAFLDYNSFKHEVGVGNTSSSTIFGITPRIVASRAKWKLRVAANIVFSNLGRQNFYIYPDLYFKYDLVKDIIIPYAGIRGGLKRNGFKQLTQTNAFLVSNPNITNENTKIDVFAGVRGEVASNLSFNLGLSYKSVEDMALFVNQYNVVGGFAVANEFNVVYDDVNTTNLFAEAGFQRIKDFSFLIRGDYYLYQVKNQKAAWHLPDLKITFNGKYNIGEKITLSADIFFINERTAFSLNPVGNENLGGGVYGKKLDPLIDLNLAVEYYFTPRWTAFVRTFNLANSNYAVYNEYYQQGITFLVGSSWRFWQDKKRKK